MNKRKPLLEKLETTLGYSFKDMKILEESIIHKSYAHENSAQKLKHNERLEFLGDAVLDLVVSDLLMEKFPESPEGELSRIRASIVNEDQLAKLAMKLEIGKSIYLGKGEELTKGRVKASILANTYEAIVAAIYLDGGYDAVYTILQEHFHPILEEASKSDINRDYKTKLQEEAQALHKIVPHYVVIEEKGPDHDKVFQIQVSLKGKPLAFGSGKSKKEAEQDAARNALKIIREEEAF
ncbi:MAG: ribonuclease III [Deltaproteobacteria bacterium]|nr:ribonuclease III [Deltaproteobacteria bacterium]